MKTKTFSTLKKDAVNHTFDKGLYPKYIELLKLNNKKISNPIFKVSKRFEQTIHQR